MWCTRPVAVACEMLAARSRGCRHCTLNPELAQHQRIWTSRKASTDKDHCKFRYKRNKSEMLFVFSIIVLGVSDP